MTHKEYKEAIEKHFTQCADSDLIIEVNERQMIPQKLSFNRFYHLYQALHLEKYGEYLQIEIKDN
jgi:hypothetical protein